MIINSGNQGKSSFYASPRNKLASTDNMDSGCLFRTLLTTICWEQTATHLDHRHAEVGIDEGCGSSSFYGAQLQGRRKSQSWNSLWLPYLTSSVIFAYLLSAVPYFNSGRNTYWKTITQLIKGACSMAAVCACRATGGQHSEIPLFFVLLANILYWGLQ